MKNIQTNTTPSISLLKDSDEQNSNVRERMWQQQNSSAPQMSRKKEPYKFPDPLKKLPNVFGSQEQAVAIKGFEGYYITIWGRVYSAKSGLFLEPQPDDSGYLRADLSKNGYTYHKRIHILVASHFIPNPENKPEVDHIDGNRANNSISNLRWVTPKENMAYRKELQSSKKESYEFLDPLKELPNVFGSLEQVDAIKGFEGYYITIWGRVYSTESESFLETKTDDSGYLQVNLKKNGKTESMCIHLLVASHFIPNPENKPEVDHIDGNRANNSISNLRWVAPDENMAYRKELHDLCKDHPI